MIASLETSFDAICRAVDVRIQHLIELAGQIAELQQDSALPEPDDPDDLEATAASLRNGAPPLPYWPFDPDPFGDRPSIPVSNYSHIKGFDDEAIRLGLAGAERFAAALRTDEGLWPCTLEWAQAEGLVTPDAAAELGAALLAESEAAHARMFALERALIEDRPDLVNAGSWGRLLEIATGKGLLTAHEATAIWRTIGAQRMRAVDG